jgi:hypothetical protein
LKVSPSYIFEPIGSANDVAPAAATFLFGGVTSETLISWKSRMMIRGSEEADAAEIWVARQRIFWT